MTALRIASLIGIAALAAASPVSTQQPVLSPRINFTGSSLRTLGHFVQQDDPGLVASAVRQVLDWVEAARSER